MQRFGRLVFLICAVFPAAIVSAGEPMRYLYHPPESSLDKRYGYSWEILSTALERTQDTYGPFIMEQSTTRMTEKRQAFEMRAANGKLTVMYLSTTPEFERDLIPVRIPVDRNLSGYFLLLVRQEELPRFAAVKTVDDLKPFTFGLGLGWVDVDILKSSGMKVVTGSNYDGLFDMLVNRRFDVFPRSAIEVLDEYDQRKPKMPQLAIAPGLLLYYPLPMYFWFSKTPQGQRLAARAEEGMRSMIADGTYERIFNHWQKDEIERLDLKHRRILSIPNTLLGRETPFGDKRLWFDPQTGY